MAIMLGGKNMGIWYKVS